MKTVHAELIGRFGNQLFIYAAARALAESYGYHFSCAPWIGQQIFDLDEPVNETPDPDPITVKSYCQNQQSLIYTRKQVRHWFKFKPAVADILARNVGTGGVVAHRRVGDYIDLGYVVPSLASYTAAAAERGYAFDHIVREEHPLKVQGFEGDLSFLPDFWRLMNARILFRGNSTFSWWAATLGAADEVYSPVIDDLEGGKEQDGVKFVRGNHPRFAQLPFVTDLFLRPE